MDWRHHHGRAGRAPHGGKPPGKPPVLTCWLSASCCMLQDEHILHVPSRPFHSPVALNRTEGDESVACTQVGDQLDRGDNELQILYWLERLQREAARVSAFPRASSSLYYVTRLPLTREWRPLRGPTAYFLMLWHPSSRQGTSVNFGRVVMYLQPPCVEQCWMWQAGGRLHVLLGNHETMNAAGRFNYATLPGLVEFYNAQTLHAWGAGLKVPRPLCTHADTSASPHQAYYGNAAANAACLHASK